MRRFRAWNVRRFLKDNEVAILPTGELIFLVQGEESEYVPMNELDVEVEFHAGLKDVNGIEIFEGDTIGNNTTHTLVVAIEKGHTVIKFTDLGIKHTELIHQTVIDEMLYEITGNIHEQPYLVGF